jgi:Rieske Fe-S protein
MDRRCFLKCSVAGGAALAAGCVEVDPAPALTAAADGDGYVELRLADHPDLLLHDSPLTLHFETHNKRQRDLLIVNSSSRGWVVLDALCTHLQCPLGYSARSQLVECPCHGSTFQLDGKVRHGPARAPLSSYPVQADGERIRIDIGGDGPSVIGGRVTLALADYPALAGDGSAIVKPRGLDDTLMVVRVGDAVHCESALCPHKGCQVELDPPSATLICPCHGSVFDVEGHRLSGLAMTDLAPYPAQLDGDSIVITVA